MIFEGIRDNLRFAQIVGLKVVEIYYQNSVRFQIRQIHFQGGGVHRDQNVDRIAGSVNIARRKVYLEPADAGQGAGRGADFRRKVGESGQIVAVQRHWVGELAAGNLHAVARISTESDDGVINYFTLALRNFNGGQSHSFLGPHVHKCGEIGAVRIYFAEIFHADENPFALGKRSTTRQAGTRKLGTSLYASGIH